MTQLYKHSAEDSIGDSFALSCNYVYGLIQTEVVCRELETGVEYAMKWEWVTVIACYIYLYICVLMFLIYNDLKKNFATLLMN